MTASHPTPLTLRLAHDPTAIKPADDIPEGWQADTYMLTAARAAGVPETEVALPEDAVLELLLEDGTYILLPAEDAPRYLGEPLRGADAAHGVITVGKALRLDDPGAAGGAARDGLGRWLLKALRVYRQGPSGMTALALAGSFQDGQLGHRVGLFHCHSERWELQPVQAIPPGEQPVLLFIHGTASPTAGSFQGLWQEESRQRIAGQYGGRIYGFEHRSLTESPIHNALDLVRTLPQGVRLHLVTKSALHPRPYDL